MLPRWLASGLPPVGGTSAEAVVLYRRTEAVTREAVGRSVFAGPPAIDHVCAGFVLQQQAVECLAGENTCLEDVVLDLLRVGPKPAFTGTGGVDHVDIPTADK